MRLSLLLVTVASALSLAHCSHDSNTLTVSPPLPPAEEPPDDAPGAYVSDAGALPGAGNRRDDDARDDESTAPRSAEPE